MLFKGDNFHRKSASTMCNYTPLYLRSVNLENVLFLILSNLKNI